MRSLRGFPLSLNQREQSVVFRKLRGKLRIKVSLRTFFINSYLLRKFQVSRRNTIEGNHNKLLDPLNFFECLIKPTTKIHIICIKKEEEKKASYCIEKENGWTTREWCLFNMPWQFPCPLSIQLFPLVLWCVLFFLNLFYYLFGILTCYYVTKIRVEDEEWWKFGSYPLAYIRIYEVVFRN